MGHFFRTNVVRNYDAERKIIELEYCNDNDFYIFQIEDFKQGINLNELFKPGTCIVTNCHECTHDEITEGDYIKVITKDQFDEYERTHKFGDWADFYHGWDFKKDQPIYPENEVLVIPYG